MSRRLALSIAFISANLMACCCGGMPVNPPPAAAPLVIEEVKPIQKDEPPAPPVAVARGRLRVSRADFGEKWPLTVESGEVECRLGHVIVFHHAGKTYAVNGAAHAPNQNFKDIAAIWRDDPAFPGLKVSMSPLIDAGRKLCK